jgi:hypothetical protein
MFVAVVGGSSDMKITEFERIDEGLRHRRASTDSCSREFIPESGKREEEGCDPHESSDPTSLSFVT